MSIEALAEALGFEDPGAILATMRRFYDDIDEAVTAESKGLGLPCKPGCDACCHEAVFLSAPEFLVVADALSGRPDLPRIVAEMTTLAAQFDDELELLETIEGPERDEVAARVKFRCPLLGEDGCCTVYDARELNARTFGLSWDGARGHAFGCDLTHERLRVIQPVKLFDARVARQRLIEALPEEALGGPVHVYPWWFAKYGALLSAG